jgi:hypothetical protein
MKAYQQWWDNKGSAMRPYDHEDYEEFARRMTAIAWSNAEEVEREACAKVCAELVPDISRTANNASVWDVSTFNCAEAIRARGQQ